jgi:hypothetical protein
MIALKIVALVLGGVLALLLLLLALIVLIPFWGEARARHPDPTEAVALVRWFWGAIQVRFGLGEDGARGELRLLGFLRFKLWPSKKKKKKKKKKEKKKKPKKEKPSLRERLEQGVPPYTMVAVRRLVRALRLQLRAQGIYGFDEPMHTGLSVGAWESLRPHLPREAICLELTPDYTGAALEGEVQLQLRVWVLALAWTGLTFFLSREGRAFWRALRRQKKEQKRRSLQQLTQLAS